MDNLANVRLGGGIGRYIRGTLTDHHKEVISAKRKGQKDSPETRRKKSVATSGTNNHMSKGHSEASRAKMRESWKIRKMRAANV